MTAASHSIPGDNFPKTERDSEELKRFRQEWLEELEKRRNESQGTPTSSAINTEDGSITPRQGEVMPPTHTSLKGHVKAGSPSTTHVVRNNEEAFMPPSLRKALGIYHLAVEQEQTGNLDEALLLYRQAFRLHDKVDRAYQRELKLVSTQGQKVVRTRNNSDIVEDISSTVVKLQSPTKPTIVSGRLVKIIQAFPVDLRFEPENENEPVLLNTLPEEILVLILSKLDHASIERFATLSRKARLVTLDSGLWRVLVLATYKPPQISEHDGMLSILERYKFDYRRFYLEQPRLRLDGVYIATCHYVRPGLSENRWVNVSHLITYHRYLRFFPNGQVLSLLANEEKSPRDVIQILKPTLRTKGLFVGNWKLVDTTVHLSNLVDASGRFTLPPSSLPAGTAVISHSGGTIRDYDTTPLGSGSATGIGHGHHPHNSHLPAQTDARYIFDMTLNLRSKPLGRWNKMDIQSYDSINLETGDVSPIVLKHERPFWFSKVRSYA